MIDFTTRKLLQGTMNVFAFSWQSIWPGRGFEIFISLLRCIEFNFNRIDLAVPSLGSLSQHQSDDPATRPHIQDSTGTRHRSPRTKQHSIGADFH
jgi:hypothetical protein